MTLAEFKSLYAVPAINLYPSTTGSGRLVGTAITNKGEKTVITKNTEVKNPVTGAIEIVNFSAVLPVHVYFRDVADKDTGEISELVILSNKEPKTPAMTL